MEIALGAGDRPVLLIEIFVQELLNLCDFGLAELLLGLTAEPSPALLDCGFLLYHFLLLMVQNLLLHGSHQLLDWELLQQRFVLLEILGGVLLFGFAVVLAVEGGELVQQLPSLLR